VQYSYVVGYFQKKLKSGNTNLESSFYTTHFLAKFNKNGKQLWIKKFDKHNQFFQCRLARDKTGSIFMTGSFQDTIFINKTVTKSKGKADIFIIKSDSGGVFQWCRTLGGPGEERVHSITTTKNNEVIIGGYYEDSVSTGPLKIISKGQKDAIIACYDESGNATFLRSYGGPFDDEVNTLVVDKQRNLFAGGNFTQTASFNNHTLVSNGYQDAFLCSFDHNGLIKWVTNCGGMSDDGASSLCVNENHEVILSGTFKQKCFFKDITTGLCQDSLVSTSGFGNIFIAKFDSTGKVLLSQKLSSSSEAIGNCMINPKKMRLYIGGTFRKDLKIQYGTSSYQLTSAGGKDVFFLKLSDECQGFKVHITIDTLIGFNKTYLLNAGAGYSSYLWNDTIIGTQFFLATTPGKYKVLVTNEFRCQARDSVIIVEEQLPKSMIVMENDNQKPTSNIVVYPNPTEGKFIIKISGSSELLEKVELFDPSGKVFDLLENIGKDFIEVDLSVRSTGFYFCRITTSKDIYTYKILKN
jgi:hypothetical protein